MLDKIITYSFYLLFFLTPLFWTSKNFELFEYNKMILVYAFTTVIVGAWLLKSISDKKLIIKRTPLDIPLLLFLGANIISTVFSIDRHVSVWGYYSRSNGGLLSLISYLLLYWAFVSNMDFEKVKTTLKFGLVSGFIISLWGILEHFGVSPSCVILRNEFNASCWVQQVQERVFATLGQPNWLAGYLAMLIFPALYFFLTATTKLSLTTYYLLLTTFYLAFTFTYSRGPTLGLIGGVVVFLICYTFCHPEGAKRPKDIIIRFFASLRMTKLGVVLASFLIVNLLFGSALSNFRLISKFAAPIRPGIALPQAPATGGTQLETGGTESGQIRLIVWKGALDIFKNYPIFGAGLESFAQIYYQYRPVEHNLTSEWDFLYNKAHNEYLNYLATTGIVGIGTYMLVIGTFVFWCIKRILKFKVQNPKFKSNLNVKNSKNLDFGIHLSFDILVLALLTSYISFLIYNFFLFSVVIIAVFFYLFPALVFVATDSAKPVTKLPSFLLRTTNYLLQTIYRRPFYTQTAKGIITVSIIYLLYSIFQLWYADTLFAQGQRALEAGNPGRAYNFIVSAVNLNKGEPFYRSELALAAAQAATSLDETEATLAAQLKDETVSLTERVLRENPGNVSYLRTAVRTYFELSLIDRIFTDKTLDILDKSIKLAPTDPKLHYNKALILATTERKDEEIKALQEALRLKPDYLEVFDQLKEAKTK